jgi:probable addiction module antidote protein
MTVKPFKETLYRELQDDEFASAYLEDALGDSTEEFLVALRHVVTARGGMTHVAGDAGLTREAMYRMLSENGNPEFRSVQKLLAATRLAIHVSPLKPANTADRTATQGEFEEGHSNRKKTQKTEPGLATV